MALTAQTQWRGPVHRLKLANVSASRQLLATFVAGGTPAHKKRQHETAFKEAWSAASVPVMMLC